MDSSPLMRITASYLRPKITPTDFGVPPEYQERAENYAKWVAACEREACAQVCDEAHELMNSSFAGAARAIRARG